MWGGGGGERVGEGGGEWKEEWDQLVLAAP